MKKLTLDKNKFLELEKKIFELGLDSDSESFDVIKDRLKNKKVFNEDEFFNQCSYVILASGFSQKTAKHKHQEIMSYFTKCGDIPAFRELIKIFGNINKINAIIKIWENKCELCSRYYLQKTLDEKLNYLSKLPHIGKITANHLARNLGENVVKYDVWIQRLGIRLYGNEDDLKLIGSPLNPKIKCYADMIFEKLANETEYPIGYIDLILWKASQEKLI